MIKINTVVVKDIYELADMVNSMYHNVTSYDGLNNVVVVAKYYEAKTLIENLISERGYEIGNITDLSDVVANGYSDEYIVTLFVNEINCEPAKVNNRYKDIYADAIYILENCNSKVMSNIHGEENVFEVYIDENDCEDDYDYDEDCENYDCCGNDTYYFDVKSGTYEINGKKDSKKELSKYLEKNIEEMSKWTKTASSILSEYEAIHNSIKRIYKLDDLLRF